jgi:uncharacterized repeat protein (TIGR01451 family)
MSTVTGTLYYDGARSNVTTGLPGIGRVPIVLENVDTQMRLAVYTGETGVYRFTGVPDGNYRLVEAYGDGGPFSSTGDWAEAAKGEWAVAVTPPIGYAPGASSGATHLDCITKNTIVFTVSGESAAGRNFSNGPVRYSPIRIDPSVNVNWDENLISAADAGTFGEFAAGTTGMTGADPNPYPYVNPDFKYVLPAAGKEAPIDGEFTIQNIANNISYNQHETWWRIADHSTGNERGRMMVINGYRTNAVFFRNEVQVKPNTYYLFATWILNLIKISGRVNPQLGVRIVAPDGKIIFEKDLEKEIPVNPRQPEWHEIGTLIFTGDFTHLFVEFVSLGEAASGNDYAIDDVGLFEAHLPQIVPVAETSKPEIKLGETTDFIIVFTNETQSDMTNLRFNYLLPNELEFVGGTIKINDTDYPDYDPAEGFALPNLLPGEGVTIRLQARATNIPPAEIATSFAAVTYDSSLVEGVAPISFASESNRVAVRIKSNSHCSPCDSFYRPMTPMFNFGQ